MATRNQVMNLRTIKPLSAKPLTWEDSKLTDLTAYCASVDPE